MVFSISIFDASSSFRLAALASGIKNRILIKFKTGFDNVWFTEAESKLIVVSCKVWLTSIVSNCSALSNSASSFMRTSYSL